MIGLSPLLSLVVVVQCSPGSRAGWGKQVYCCKAVDCFLERRRKALLWFEVSCCFAAPSFFYLSPWQKNYSLQSPLYSGFTGPTCMQCTANSFLVSESCFPSFFLFIVFRFKLLVDPSTEHIFAVLLRSTSSVVLLYSIKLSLYLPLVIGRCSWDLVLSRCTEIGRILLDWYTSSVFLMILMILWFTGLPLILKSCSNQMSVKIYLQLCECAAMSMVLWITKWASLYSGSLMLVSVDGLVRASERILIF